MFKDKAILGQGPCCLQGLCTHWPVPCHLLSLLVVPLSSSYVVKDAMYVDLCRKQLSDL